MVTYTGDALNKDSLQMVVSLGFVSSDAGGQSIIIPMMDHLPCSGETAPQAWCTLSLHSHWFFVITFDKTEIFKQFVLLHSACNFTW